MESSGLNPWVRTTQAGQYEKSDIVNYSYVGHSEALINQVKITKEYGPLIIFLKGPQIKKIYKAIVEKLDKKYSDLWGSVFLKKSISISVTNMYTDYSNELRSTLNKIYNSIETLFPDFTYLSKTIDQTIIFYPSRNWGTFFLIPLI